MPCKPGWGQVLGQIRGCPGRLRGLQGKGATRRETGQLQGKRPIDRVIIALRLWAGCIWAAKTVAEGTLSGANTPTMQADAFAQIDDYARNDPVFAAGVEAAPAFKRRRGETYSFDGVPDDSPVRRHPG